MLEARHGAWWDADKIGLSSPPIETPKGWLVLYHGVRQTATGSFYRLGLALFDIQMPECCLRRGEEWIFCPQEPYERFGDMANVVFPCGYTIGADGDPTHLYYAVSRRGGEGGTASEKGCTPCAPCTECLDSGSR